MYLNAEQLVGNAWSAGWSAPPAYLVSEWAEEHRHLSGKAASEPGPYRVARTPYAREPMDCMSVNSPVEQVVLMWGAQTSKTTVEENALGYWIDVEPGPIMFVQPTLGLAKRFSKQRISTLIEATPALRQKVASNKSRDESNTTLMKDFDGGVLVIAGANSAADLRSMPVRYLILDEIDAYPDDVDGEGDPIELATARQTTFARRKRIMSSTPTDEATSRIEPAFNAGDRCRFLVPCPHCGREQRITWGHIKWPKGEPKRAVMVCEDCGAEIGEEHKPRMFERARWVAEAPGAAGGKIRSFQLPSMYAPLGWVSWGELAEEFLEAKVALDAGDLTKMKVFVNTRLAETWKDQGAQAEAATLAKRAEPYALGTVPDGGLLLTAAVDVQGNRVEVEVDAWGRGEECWTIDYAVIWGEPGELLSGKDPRLDEYLRQAWRNVHGAEIHITATAVDSGGHYTHDVYMFCRNRRHRHIFAVKGQSIAGKPVLGRPSQVDVDYRGTKIKHGAQLWPVGSDTAKELLHARLRIEAPGPGYVHFSTGLPPEYYEQLASERLVTRYHKGRPRREWVLPKGKRNEALDLKVYNIAAAYYAGISRIRDTQWDAMARRYGPGLFTTPAAAPAPDAPAAAVAPAVQTSAPTTRRPRRVGGVIKR